MTLCIVGMDPSNSWQYMDLIASPQKPSLTSLAVIHCWTGSSFSRQIAGSLGAWTRAVINGAVKSQGTWVGCNCGGQGTQRLRVLLSNAGRIPQYCNLDASSPVRLSQIVTCKLCQHDCYAVMCIAQSSKVETVCTATAASYPSPLMHAHRYMGKPA